MSCEDHFLAFLEFLNARLVYVHPQSICMPIYDFNFGLFFPEKNLTHFSELL